MDLAIDHRRTFWIIFTISFIFVILGVIFFLNIVSKEVLSSASIMLLFGIWFLNVFLTILFAYYAVIHAFSIYSIVMIYILYFLTLLFMTLWTSFFTTNIMFSNMCIVLSLIFGLALIYLTHTGFHALGIIYLLLWLFVFFYLNTQHD